MMEQTFIAVGNNFTCPGCKKKFKFKQKTRVEEIPIIYNYKIEGLSDPISGESIQDVFEILCSHYTDIAMENDDKLSPGAQKLKKELLEIMEEE